MFRQLLVLGFALTINLFAKAEGRNEQSILPKPSGPYAIGTMKVFVTDSTRMETFIAKKKHREIYVKIWFPAQVEGQPEYETLLADYPDEVVADIFKAVGLDKELVGKIKESTTNTVKGKVAPIRGQKFPVVLFNPGFYFGMADFYTGIAENLASNGFIVCSVNHPYEQPYVEQSGKGVLMKKKKAQLAYLQLVLVEKFRKFELDTDKQIEDATRIYLKKLKRFDRVLRRWTTDNKAFIDYLYYVCKNDSGGGVFEVMDVDRIGVMGQSLGGAVAGQLCIDDNERITAGVNLDGFQFGDIIDRPVEMPFMLMESEHYELWRIGNEMVFRNSGPDFHSFTAKRAKHFLFSDAVSLHFIDEADLKKMIGDVNSNEIDATVNEYIRAFFSKYLKGVDEPLLENNIDNDQYRHIKLR